MKIAMILSSLANTGPGIVARDLLIELKKMGHVCALFYFDSKYGLDVPGESIQLINGDEIEFNQWDVIHSHGFRPDRYVAKHIDAIRRAGCHSVSTLHQPIDYKELHKSYGKLKSLIGAILWKRNLKNFDRIAVLNTDTLKSLSISLQVKSMVIFNGRTIHISDIDDKDKDFILDLKKRYTIIGTCSWIIKRKGLEQIVKAMVNLPCHAFIAVGKGDQVVVLNKLAKDLGVSDRCFFIGYRENSVDYLPYFDIFLMCTRSEGFPLALIEAASQGLYVVLSDIPILKAIMSEDLVSFYHLDDIESLTNVIRESKFDKGELLKKYYLENLTAESMAQRYISLYDSIIQ